MPTENIDLDQVDVSKVEAAADTLKSLIAESYPTVDVTDGTSLNQLLLDISSILSALNQEEIDLLQSSWSLLTVSENPDDADGDLVDKILANYFVTRRQGENAAGRVVIVISTRVTTALPGTLILTVAGKTYTPTQAFIGVVNEEGVISSRDRLITERSDGNYAFVIDMVADEAGIASQVKKDTRFTVSPSFTNYVDSYAEADFQGGEDVETNTELIQRLDQGIAAKATADRLSISGIVRDEFPNMRELSIIGYGDEEMNRDRYNFAELSTGGKADVYSRMRTIPVLSKVTKSAVLVDAEEKTWQANFVRTELPGFYRVESVLHAGSGAAGTLALVSDVRGLDLTSEDGLYVPQVEVVADGVYSSYQTAVIQFTDPDTPVADLIEGESTADYDFYIRYMPNLLELQRSIFSNRGRRAPGSDYLSKAPIPCFISIKMKVVYREQFGVPDAAAIADAVADAVNALDFSEPRLSASHIIDAVHDVVGTAGYVDLPIDMRGTLRLPDGRELLLADPDGLEIPPYHDLGVSKRTTSFFLEQEDVEVLLEPATVWRV